MNRAQMLEQKQAKINKELSLKRAAHKYGRNKSKFALSKAMLSETNSVFLKSNLTRVPNPDYKVGWERS